MRFGDDLMFNQVGFEAPDTSPAWKGLFDVADDARTFHFGWVWVDGEARHLTRVRRDVARYHPELFAALEQQIEAEDETGATWRFSGRAHGHGPSPVVAQQLLRRRRLPLGGRGRPGRSLHLSGGVVPEVPPGDDRGDAV